MGAPDQARKAQQGSYAQMVTSAGRRLGRRRKNQTRGDAHHRSRDIVYRREFTRLYGPARPRRPRGIKRQQGDNAAACRTLTARRGGAQCKWQRDASVGDPFILEKEVLILNNSPLLYPCTSTAHGFREPGTRIHKLIQWPPAWPPTAAPPLKSSVLELTTSGPVALPWRPAPRPRSEGPPRRTGRAPRRRGEPGSPPDTQAPAAIGAATNVTRGSEPPAGQRAKPWQ